MTGPVSSDRIGVERPCHRCGYSLRGLPAGGSCPECGMPIRRSRGRSDDSLAGAPLEYLKTLAAGLLAMAACSIGGAVAISYARGASALHGSAWLLVLCVGWWCGVWIVTRPRPFGDATVPDALLDSAALRNAVRLTQLAWLVAAAGYVVAAFVPVLTAVPGAVTPLGPAPNVPPPPPPAELWGRRIAMLAEPVGFLSIVPLSILLSALSAWAGDAGLAERFRWSAWGVAVGGAAGLFAMGLTAGAGGTFGPVLFGGGLVAVGVAMVAQVLFIASLVHLAYLAMWSISNAHQRLVVDDRLARRAEEDRRRLEQRVAAADRAMRAPARGAGLGPANQPVVERPRGGAEPYGVDPGAG